MNLVQALHKIGFDFSGAERRLAVVSTALGLPEAKASQFDDKLAEFSKNIVSSHLPTIQQVSYFWLALSGKYLNEYWLERFSAELQTDKNSEKMMGFVLYSCEVHPVLLLSAVKVNLAHLDPDCVIIDVSHTIKYAYNSGIQRVLRKTVEQLFSSGKKFRLVVFNEALNALQLLPETETKSFVTFVKTTDEKGLGRGSSSWKERLRFRKDHHFAYELVRISYSTILIASEILGGSSHTVVGLRRDLQAVARYIVRKQIFSQGFFRKRTIVEQEMVLPFKNSFLQMEVVLELPRVEMFVCLKKGFDCELTLLAYDLIPVMNPEYCVVSGPFVNYLRLFRFADKVSCISKTTEAQMRSFVQVLENQSRLLIEVHLLAGDFVKRPSKSPNPGKTPLLLAVGTIEPRKNQIGILRAANTLWREGHRFRLVFAGSCGWLYESFAQELRESQAMGLAVDHLVSPSESDLISLYQECYFTLFCSLAEGFGLPVAESQAFGRVCITSDHGSMREIAVLGGGCLLIDTSKNDEIVNAMRTLLTDDQKMEQIYSTLKPEKLVSWKDYANQIYKFGSKN